MTLPGTMTNHGNASVLSPVVAAPSIPLMSRGSTLRRRMKSSVDEPTSISVSARVAGGRDTSAAGKVMADIARRRVSGEGAMNADTWPI